MNYPNLRLEQNATSLSCGHSQCKDLEQARPYLAMRCEASDLEDCICCRHYSFVEEYQ